MMNAKTIKQKIAWGSGLLAGAFLLQAGATAIMERKNEQSVHQLENSTESMQDHMQADMKHDAIRGSVYRGLYLAEHGDMNGLHDAAQQVGEYSDELTAAVNANKKLEHEPAINPKLKKLTNVVLLPHMGSGTIEGRIDMGEKVIINIKTFADGHKPPDRVIPAML